MCCLNKNKVAALVVKYINNINPSNWNVIVFEKDQLDHYLHYSCTFSYMYERHIDTNFLILSGELFSIVIEMI
jgi:hypothetical protein